MKMEKTQRLFMKPAAILLLLSQTTASLVSVTRCDNVEKVGSVLNVDFMKMNQPCSCTVRPRFNGDLVFASNVVLYDCNTEVTVQKSSGDGDDFPVRCPKEHTSKMYNVDNSSVFQMTIKYLNVSTDKSFHQSIQIFQDRSFSSPIAVSCTVDESVVIPPQTEEKPTDSSNDQGLLTGLIVCGILVATLMGIIIFLIIRNIRNQKRQFDEKERPQENPETGINRTSPALPNRPNPAYTALSAQQTNSQAEQPYTRLHSDTGQVETSPNLTNRPSSAYTALNPEQSDSPTEQSYTEMNREPESNESVYQEINPESTGEGASAALTRDHYISMTALGTRELHTVTNSHEEYVNASDTHL